MSARTHILAALRQAGYAPASVSASATLEPSMAASAASGVTRDAVDRFTTAVQAAAGRVHRVPAGQSAAELARELFADAARVSAADGLWPMADATPPVQADGELSMLDVAVAHGRFGVVENGAVWVDGGAGVPRVALWLCRHLVLVLDRAQLVTDMHAAYRRLGEAPMPDFGAFISGPSKTADIEQCLVIGAHGPLSLDVLLV